MNRELNTQTEEMMSVFRDLTALTVGDSGFGERSGIKGGVRKQEQNGP
jgi:hypothetical protein